MIHPDDPPFAPFAEPGQTGHYVHAPADFNAYADSDFLPTWCDFFPSDSQEGQSETKITRTGYNANNTSSYTSASGARDVAGSSYRPLGTNTSSFVPTYETFNGSGVSPYAFPLIPSGPPDLLEPYTYGSYGNNEPHNTSEVDFSRQSSLPSVQMAPERATLANDSRSGILHEVNIPVAERPIFTCDVPGCLRTFAKVGERKYA